MNSSREDGWKHYMCDGKHKHWETMSIEMQNSCTYNLPGSRWTISPGSYEWVYVWVTMYECVWVSACVKVGMCVIIYNIITTTAFRLLYKWGFPQYILLDWVSYM